MFGAGNLVQCMWQSVSRVMKWKTRNNEKPDMTYIDWGKDPLFWISILQFTKRANLHLWLFPTLVFSWTVFMTVPAKLKQWEHATWCHIFSFIIWTSYPSVLINPALYCSAILNSMTTQQFHLYRLKKRKLKNLQPVKTLTFWYRWNIYIQHRQHLMLGHTLFSVQKRKVAFDIMPCACKCIFWVDFMFIIMKHERTHHHMPQKRAI